MVLELDDGDVRRHIVQGLSGIESLRGDGIEGADVFQGPGDPLQRLFQALGDLGKLVAGKRFHVAGDDRPLHIPRRVLLLIDLAEKTFPQACRTDTVGLEAAHDIQIESGVLFGDPEDFGQMGSGEDEISAFIEGADDIVEDLHFFRGIVTAQKLQAEDIRQRFRSFSAYIVQETGILGVFPVIPVIGTVLLVKVREPFQLPKAHFLLAGGHFPGKLHKRVFRRQFGYIIRQLLCIHLQDADRLDHLLGDRLPELHALRKMQ